MTLAFPMSEVLSRFLVAFVVLLLIDGSMHSANENTGEGTISAIEIELHLHDDQLSD